MSACQRCQGTLRPGWSTQGRSYVMVALCRSPRYRPPVSEEAAGGAVVRKGRRPDRRVGALFDRAGGTRSAHVGAHPSRADGVHEDAAPAQLGGQDASEDVQARLGDAVARRATTHVVECTHTAGDVDDPAEGIALKEGKNPPPNPPRPEQVGL